MEKKKPPRTILYSESRRTFESNLDKLVYFLGTTEGWYEKQVRILERQVRAARRELPQLEMQIDKFLEKSGLSKADEEWFTELAEKVEDLTDIDIFVPMEAKMFRQFSELIRILGLTYLVTVFKGYLVDIVREILITHPDALKSKRELTAEEVLAQGGWKQIISYLAGKEGEKLENDSFQEVAEYFDDKFNINLNAAGASAEKITEILATRNIHIHNKGMVNQHFRKLVKGSTLRVGTYKSITRGYLRDSIGYIATIVKFIDTKVKTKYLAS